MYGGQGSFAAMWVLWLVFIIGRTVVVSGKEDIEESKYIEASRDPKNYNQSQEVGEETNLAPVIKKLPIEPLRKSNLDPGRESFEISLCTYLRNPLNNSRFSELIPSHNLQIN
jgi:hypothetical protein